MTPLFDFSVASTQTVNPWPKRIAASATVIAAASCLGYRISLAIAEDNDSLSEFLAESGFGFAAIATAEICNPQWRRQYANFAFLAPLMALQGLSTTIQNSDSNSRTSNRFVCQSAQGLKVVFSITAVAAHALGMFRSEGGTEGTLFFNSTHAPLNNLTSRETILRYVAATATAITGIVVGELVESDLGARFLVYGATLPLGAHIVQDVARRLAQARDNETTGSLSMTTLLNVAQVTSTIAMPSITAIAITITHIPALTWPLAFLGLTHGASLAADRIVEAAKKFKNPRSSMLAEFKRRLCNRYTLAGTTALVTFAIHQFFFDPDVSTSSSQKTALGIFFVAAYSSYVFSVTARIFAQSLSTNRFWEAAHFLTSDRQLLFPIVYTVIRSTTRLKSDDVEQASSSTAIAMNAAYGAYGVIFGSTRANNTVSSAARRYGLQVQLSFIALYFILIYIVDKIFPYEDGHC